MLCLIQVASDHFQPVFLGLTFQKKHLDYYVKLAAD